MKKCVACGAEQKNDAKFCCDCGALLNNVDESQQGNRGVLNSKETYGEGPTTDITEESQQTQNNTNNKELEEQYKKVVEQEWFNNKPALILYNLVKLVAIFFCWFSGINFFVNDRMFIGIIAMAGIGFLGLCACALIETCFIDKSLVAAKEALKNEGLTDFPWVTPPGVREKVFLVAFIAIAVLCFGLKVAEARGHNSERGVAQNTTLSHDILEEAYQEFNSVMLNEYDIYLPNAWDRASDVKYGGKDAVQFHVSASVDTLFGKESVNCIGIVTLSGSSPDVLDEIIISEQTRDYINQLIRTEDDLLYSLKAFDHYHELLDTTIKQSDFIRRMMGRTVTWTATVEGVYKSGLFGDNLVTAKLGNSIDCCVYFQDVDYDNLLKLNAGQTITFTGVFDGFLLLGEYNIEDARLVQW